MKRKLKRFFFLHCVDLFKLVELCPVPQTQTCRASGAVFRPHPAHLLYAYAIAFYQVVIFPFDVLSSRLMKPRERGLCSDQFFYPAVCCTRGFCRVSSGVLSRIVDAQQEVEVKCTVSWHEVGVAEPASADLRLKTGFMLYE